MAPRKTTASADRNASRKTQDAAGDQAGLVALTTTLLAGAVTGAVAGLIDTADARQLRHDSGTPSPDEPRSHDDRIEPEQAPHILGASTAHADAVQPLRPDEAVRIDAAQVTNADPVTLPQIQEMSSHQPAADAIVMSQAAATAGSPSVSPVDEATGATARAPAVETASPNGAVTSSSVADQPGTIVSSIDPVGTHQTVSSFDDVSDRIDHAIAAINDGLTGSFAAIDTGQADIARTLGDVRETLDSKLGSALEQIDGQVSRLADTIDDIGASLADVFAKTSLALIPASILGAEQDDRQPDGLLAKLFDTVAVVPSSEAGREAVHDTADAIAHSVASSPISLSALSIDFQVPELTSIVDTLKIGFAGQPYAESLDGHDAPTGSHANLLHGLL